jgi:hypothetical protein
LALDKYNILSKSQYGFRAKHSTNHAIIDLVNTVSKHLDDGKVTAGLFINISKAFDSLNHKILLPKMYAYGFRGFMQSWFSSYLTNRLQFVDTDGVKSNLAQISLGVPQGSVLGPILFLLYINDLPLISNLCKFILFADDTTILFNEESYDNLTSLITSTLSLLLSWFDSNRLCLNLQKTCVLPFNLTRFVSLNNFSSKSSIISCVRSMNFLGIILDYKLSWSMHVDYVCNKLTHCVAMLKVCSHLMPFSLRRQLYFAFAYPYIMYGCEYWGAAGVMLINRVTVLQKRILRLIFNLFPRSHCAPYASFARVLYVADAYKLMLLKLAFNIFHNNSVPAVICNCFKKPVHSHFTRAVSYNFFALNSNVKVYHDSPVLSCIRLWNNLDISIKSLSSLSLFKYNVMQFMFNGYT